MGKTIEKINARCDELRGHCDRKDKGKEGMYHDEMTEGLPEEGV